MSKFSEVRMHLTRTALAAIATSLLLAALAVPARAGTYDVFACDANVAGGANNSWSPQADGGTVSFTDCPAGRGLTTRNVYDNGQSGFLQGAYLIFEAPGGTSVDSVSFEAGWERANCSWSVGLAADNGDFGGTYLWGYPAGQYCDSGTTPGDNNFFPNYRWGFGAGTQRLRLEARCGAGSCPRNGTNAVRIKNVQVRVRDDQPPTLSAGRGALWTSNGWLAGTQSVGFNAGDGSGVRELTVAVDGREVARRTLGCDTTQRKPCPDGELDAPLSTAGFGDGQHTVLLQSVDAAGNVGTAQHVFNVDNTPPSAPTDLAVEGGDGWRPKNGFNLSWKLPSNSGSPIQAAEWELCPTTPKDAKCTRGAQTQQPLTAIKDFKVPAAGEYTLKLWLRDEAGNQDPRLLAGPVTLRLDDATPDLSWEPLSADDPTLLRVKTTDQGSGAARGEIAIRKVGTEPWQPLPTNLEPGGLNARLDDERLADGDYEVLARVADQAGNERSSDLRADGSKASFKLPLRLATKLRGGIVRRSGKRTKLARTAYVRYGQLVRVRGRLTTPEGNPMQDVDVQAFTQVRDGVTPQRLIATVKTSRTGRFSFLVRKGPSRDVVVRYGGTNQIRSATQQVRLHVRSSTSFRPNRRKVANGDFVTFHGRVRTGRIPQPGKNVEVQVYVRGKWRTFDSTKTDRRGLWRYQYRFDGTRGSQQYRFRAKIPTEAGYPYATGRSGIVRVRVRGA